MLSRSKAKQKAHFEKTRTLLTEKIRESMISVLPIIAIVAVLCLFLVPMQPTLLLTFLVGALMIVVGLGLFSLGAERSMTIIGSKIGISMKVGLISMVISLPLGMALGILMARSKGGIADKLGNAYIVFIQAVPNAVYFIFIQLYGSDLFRVSMLYKETEWTSLILPVISLALPSISSYAMWLRRYMVDETNKDYIKLARAKGVPNSTIWFRHVFRNSVVPMVNLIPGSILLTISGSIYVESLYSIPGMGGLLVDVIKRQDNNMVLALVVIFAVMSILGLLLGDGCC